MTSDAPTGGQAAPRPLWQWGLLVALLGVVAVFTVRLVGQINWSAVGDAIAALSWQQGMVLVAMLVVRQVLNAVPMAFLVPGLTARQALHTDLSANLVATITPPPSDLVLRVAMFRSWGVPVADGMAGLTISSFVFYAVRLTVPVLGLLLLSAEAAEGGDSTGAVVAAAVGVALLGGVVLMVKLPGLAGRLGRAAGAAVRRVRSGVDPVEWGERCETFRSRIADGVGSGSASSYLALVGMVLVDGLILVLSLRFVGVTAAELSGADIVAALLLAYPLTVLPLFGLGVLDTAVVVTLLGVGGESLQDPLIAGLVVWRTVTLLGTLLLGVVSFLLWRRGSGRSLAWREAGTAAATDTDASGPGGNR